MENLNPIPDGDIYLVPLNMVSLEQAGKPPEPVAPASPAVDDEPDDSEDEAESDE